MKCIHSNQGANSFYFFAQYKYITHFMFQCSLPQIARQLEPKFPEDKTGNSRSWGYARSFQ